MYLRKVFAKLKIQYFDSKEEEEYLQIKTPLLKDFLTGLLLCVTAVLIILIVRFFVVLDLPTQGYLSLGILFINLVLLASRNLFGKATEYLLVGYLLCIVILVIFNLEHFLLSIKSCEAFYTGYAFALLHRILGYRIVKVHFMVLFHMISLSLRLIRLYDHDLMTSLMVTFVEILTVSICVKSERSERDLFDSLYKSRKQLYKFKDFMTEHLPDQMIVFSQDTSKLLFMNKAFQNSFECHDILHIKESFHKLVIEKESIEKNLLLFNKLGYSLNDHGYSISLFKLLDLFTAGSDLIRESGALTFEIHETNNCFDLSLPILSVRHGESFAEDCHLNNWSKAEKMGESSFKAIRLLDNLDNLKPKRSIMGKIIREESIKGCSARLSNHKSCLKYETQNQGDSFLTSPLNRKFTTKDEGNRIFKLKVLLLPWDDQEALALLFDDITQQKMITELKIADRNKDLVIASVSHELRTPLHGMLGMIDIVQKKIDDTEITTYLHSCRNSGVFLLNLVNSILDISQIKSNKPINLVESHFSVSDLLDEIKTLFGPFSTEKNLYLNIDIDKSVPKKIVTDRSRLSQILINLLANAFKFTFEGGITVKVELQEGTPNRIKFSIQDTGMGIKKEDQKNLFKLFGKLEQQDCKTNTNGVGLGLTIANDLTMLLNNSEQQCIHLESEAGKGSTFWFFIESKLKNDSLSEESSSMSCPDEYTPVAASLDPYLSSYAFSFEKIRGVISKPLSIKTEVNMPEPESREHEHFSLASPDLKKRSQSNPNQSIDNFGSKKRQMKSKTQDFSLIRKNEIKLKPWCLIVDDNPFNLMIARHLMEEKGYQIKSALNGEEAIRVAEEHEMQEEVFKVILMDCQMPIMDGFEATKILRQMMNNSRIASCPIFALTANNRDEEHEKQCIEAGMNGILTKPFQTNELERMLKLLKSKR